MHTHRQQNTTSLSHNNDTVTRAIEGERGMDFSTPDNRTFTGEGNLTTERNRIVNYEGSGTMDHNNNLITTESARPIVVKTFVPTVSPSTNHSNSLVTESFDLTKKRRKKKRKIRMLYGIMSYDSPDERKRRGLIRSTFLSYFTKHMNRTLVSEEEYNEKKHWICSLNDLDHGRLEYPEKCRMAYAFVLGANPNGPTMLLNFNESYPLSLPPPEPKTKKDEKDARDSVYLNIQENGRLGKSPTWFLYATDFLERHGWTKDFDYIFKSDTDNILYTPKFFRFVDKKLPRKRMDRVYGGHPLTYQGCGGDKHDHCKEMIGPLFMGGGCYFLSVGLAKFISDETTFDHLAVKIPHEDMTTGNFVYSHPKEIRIIREPRFKGSIRYHPVKTNKKYNFRWKKMLKLEQLFLSTGELY